MRNDAAESDLHAVQSQLAIFGDVGVAVSGGVDSMTLAMIAGRTQGCNPTMFHAVSHAVPEAATARVTAYAREHGWKLQVIDAGEFRNEMYVQNPVNRCFYCKHQLYSTITSRFAGIVVSGTNSDDLGDYRPGLKAADAFNVKHPYVVAGVDKSGVRRLAAMLEIGEIANLPASPCLSSRIETGLPISRERLATVDECERVLGEILQASVIRCRIRDGAIAIELDDDALARLTAETKTLADERIARIAGRHGIVARIIAYEPYKRGSAFVQPSRVIPLRNV